MTEVELREEIEERSAIYSKEVKTKPAHLLELQKVALKSLKIELSSLLSQGAKVCPKCSGKPLGMLKREGFTDGQGEHPPVYEVGCPVCAIRARAWTPEEAVKRWNKGELVK